MTFLVFRLFLSFHLKPQPYSIIFYNIYQLQMYLNKKIFFLAIDYSKCKMTSKGLDYNGDVSTTISGKTCQRWDSQNPHRHSFFRLQEQAHLNKNYCRNPSYYSDLWCYTTDRNTRWEWCNVPVCGNQMPVFHVFFYNIWLKTLD